MDEMMFRLSFFLSARNSNTEFKEALKQIEGSAECGGLPMISFLILPMQRVTRLPLLLDVSLTFNLQLFASVTYTRLKNKQCPFTAKLLMVLELQILFWGMHSGAGCCFVCRII